MNRSESARKGWATRRQRAVARIRSFIGNQQAQLQAAHYQKNGRDAHVIGDMCCVADPDVPVGIVYQFTGWRAVETDAQPVSVSEASLPGSWARRQGTNWPLGQESLSRYPATGLAPKTVTPQEIR